jgi:predicted nuclease of restriction endonuclease-like (RecB) superfamily
MNKKELGIRDLVAYKNFLEQTQKKIKNIRLQTAYSANKVLIELYWWIGENIVKNQEKHGWGKGIVEQLSKDLKSAFGGKAGFSPQNLWYMRQFYLEYKNKPDLQQLVGEIPWGQNLLLMSKVKDDDAKTYYINAIKENALSRSELNLQIQSKCYERQSVQIKQNNFHEVLPERLAKQAENTMKDVYMLDMLGLTEPVLEAAIEQRMVAKIKDVIMELGQGFSFIGNQYKITTPDTAYFIDLLFFNRKLQSLIALELKTTRFKAEYAGKMNFYLNLLDEFVKEPYENPSIGIILCGERRQFDVEYALRGIDKPIGVAGYELTRELPAKLKNVLPDPKELEEKILFELGIDEKDVEQDK